MSRSNALRVSVSMHVMHYIPPYTRVFLSVSVVLSPWLCSRVSHQSGPVAPPPQAGPLRREHTALPQGGENAVGKGGLPTAVFSLGCLSSDSSEFLLFFFIKDESQFEPGTILILHFGRVIQCLVHDHSRGSV